MLIFPEGVRLHVGEFSACAGGFSFSASITFCLLTELYRCSSPLTWLLKSDSEQNKAGQTITGRLKFEFRDEL